MRKTDSKVSLPYGTRCAIARALEIAIAALENLPIDPIPPNRMRMATKLKKARTKLLRAKVIWP